MFQFYDDELHNLILVSDKSLREIIAYTSKYDFHPPLQYILNKLSLQLFGLNEFWLSLPSIIFILLSIIICSRFLFKATSSMSFSVLTGVLIAFNPLVLLWGSSLRWYPLWTFLIILSTFLLIHLWNSQNRNFLVISTLIIAISLSLYTNYQTLMFLVAGLLTVLTLDLGKKNFINSKKTIYIFLSSIILFLPYLSGFIFHLQNFFIRKEIFQDFHSVSPLTSAAYFLFSILFGNSIYPWQLSFIIIFVVFAIASTTSMILIVMINKKKLQAVDLIKPLIPQNNNYSKLLRTLNIFTLYLFIVHILQVIVTGTITMRGMIYLPMLLITAFSLSVFHLYQTHSLKSELKSISYSLSIAISSLAVIWIISCYNIFTRQHLHKSGLMIPVDQIIKTIVQFQNLEKEKPLIVSTDPVITYYLLKNDFSKILSPYTSDLVRLFPKKRLSSIKEDDNLIFIKSSPGALLPLKNELDNFFRYLMNSSHLTSKPIKFAYDPDYFMKKKFFSSAEIEEWKYVFYIMKPLNKWDINYLESINGFRVY